MTNPETPATPPQELWLQPDQGEELFPTWDDETCVTHCAERLGPCDARYIYTDLPDDVEAVVVARAELERLRERVAELEGKCRLAECKVEIADAVIEETANFFGQARAVRNAAHKKIEQETAPSATPDHEGGRENENR